MKIGIVTTWFERGAGYVSKLYRQALENENEVYIYARGGLRSDADEWKDEHVSYGLPLPYTYINKAHIFKWIRRNQLDVVFFNEQHELWIVAEIKREFPNIKLGSYIDYYKEDDVELFNIFDFVICNTKRHMKAMKNHKQAFYVKWGTDINTYRPVNERHEKLTFFHSMGMSYRKGTGKLVDAFIDGKLYEESNLIIHTQLPADRVSKYRESDLKKYGIEIISKTVTAPGLYYLGDVYVYPTDLDGLGLTLYEALSCGLPVITTNNAPMNEIILEGINGKLVRVEEFKSRADGYYWPLSICDENSLIECMRYFIINKENILHMKQAARKYAEEELDFMERYSDICNIFKSSYCDTFDLDLYNKIVIKEKKDRRNSFLQGISSSSRIFSFIWKWVNGKKSAI